MSALGFASSDSKTSQKTISAQSQQTAADQGVNVRNQGNNSNNIRWAPNIVARPGSQLTVNYGSPGAVTAADIQSLADRQAAQLADVQATNAQQIRDLQDAQERQLATLTANSNVDDAQLGSVLGNLSDAVHGITDRNDPFADALNQDLVSRLQDNATRATEETTTGSPQTIVHWLLWGMAALAVTAFVFLVLRHKRK